MSVTLRVVVAGSLTLVLLAPAAAPAAPADPLAPTGESSLIARIVRPTLGHVSPDGTSPVRVRLRSTPP